MHVTIDDEKCQGHGRCYAMAPDVFDADDEGHGVVISPIVPKEFEAQAGVGAANCPESAISLS